MGICGSKGKVKDKKGDGASNAAVSEHEQAGPDSGAPPQPHTPASLIDRLPIPSPEPQQLPVTVGQGGSDRLSTIEGNSGSDSDSEGSLSGSDSPPPREAAAAVAPAAGTDSQVKLPFETTASTSGPTTAADWGEINRPKANDWAYHNTGGDGATTAAAAAVAAAAAAADCGSSSAVVLSVHSLNSVPGLAETQIGAQSPLVPVSDTDFQPTTTTAADVSDPYSALAPYRGGGAAALVPAFEESALPPFEWVTVPPRSEWDRARRLDGAGLSASADNSNHYAGGGGGGGYRYGNGYTGLFSDPSGGASYNYRHLYRDPLAATDTSGGGGAGGVYPAQYSAAIPSQHAAHHDRRYAGREDSYSDDDSYESDSYSSHDGSSSSDYAPPPRAGYGPTAAGGGGGPSPLAYLDPSLTNRSAWQKQQQQQLVASPYYDYNASYLQSQQQQRQYGYGSQHQEAEEDPYNPYRHSPFGNPRGQTDNTPVTYLFQTLLERPRGRRTAYQLDQAGY